MAKAMSGQKDRDPVSRRPCRIGASRQKRKDCRRFTCGIRRFAAIWTCGSRGMGHGFIWAHPLDGRNWCGCFPPILRKDGDNYFLVTPVEKVGITVDDAPFVAVDFEAKGEGTDQVLTF